MLLLRRLPTFAVVLLFAVLLSTCGDSSTKRRFEGRSCELGEACSNCTCGTENTCFQGICEPRHGAGEPCEKTHQCTSGHFCFEEACRVDVELGEPCDSCSNCAVCLGQGPIGMCSRTCRNEYFPSEGGRPGVHADTCPEGFNCLDGFCRPECESADDCPSDARICERVYGWGRAYVGSACHSAAPPNRVIEKELDVCPLTREGKDPADVSLYPLDGGADGGRDAGPSERQGDAGGEVAANRRFVFVNVDGATSCGIRDDHTLACWGGGSLPATFMNERVIWFDRELATCGLRPDHTIFCVDPSYPTNPLLTTPSGKFQAVSLEAGFACALSSAGAMRCWGSTGLDATVPPSGSFKALATAESGGCAIATDGAIRCWGARDNGNAPVGQFSAIAGARTSFCAIDTAGVPHCWGLEKVDKVLVPPEGVHFQSIVMDGSGACGITDQQTIACFGLLLRKPPAGQFTSVSLSSASHGCAVDLAGKIQCWAESSAADMYNNSRLMPPDP